MIVGFTDPEGSRAGFGALLLAVNDEAATWSTPARWAPASTTSTLRDLRAPHGQAGGHEAAFKNPPRGAEARRSHWVKPKLVGEVAFTEWTREGILRHPTFQGLREDKARRRSCARMPQSSPQAAKTHGRGEAPGRRRPPRPRSREEDRHEEGAQARRPAPLPRRSPSPRQGRSKKQEVEIAGVRFSNPEQGPLPRAGGDQAGAGRSTTSRIADWILPHLADRPLTLVRCPEGRAKQCFYQKHVNEHFPPSVYRVDVGEPEPYGAIDSLEGLLSLVADGRAGAPHLGLAPRQRSSSPTTSSSTSIPTRGSAGSGWSRARCACARCLEELGLQTFLKTTGGKGLHVVLPIARKDDWDEVKAFTKAVAETMVADEPGKLHLEAPQGRAARGRSSSTTCATAAAPPRSAPTPPAPGPNAPVSAPLFWEELETDVRGNTYTVRTLPERLENLRSDPWEDFFKVRQSITAAMKKAVGMK